MRITSWEVTMRLIWPRRYRRADSTGREKTWRGRVERLEDRAVLGILSGNLAMESVTSISPRVVSTQYEVTGLPLTGSLPLGIYRSPSETFSSSSLLVGETILQGADLDVGSHTITVDLTQPLDIDPSRKYVLAVADPGNVVSEASKADNTAAFRTWIVGAVTHGLELDGRFPSWVTSTATGLKADGYDAAVAFDWAALSRLPLPGAIPLATQGITAQINQAIASLPIQPDDVVDVHLIGHSRGGGVVSFAAGELDRSADPLAGGYLELTLLDPHPARNGGVRYYSSSNGPIGTLAEMQYLAFQSFTSDPPLVIPAGVDRTEIFYQQARVPEALLPDEHLLNSWGAVPAGGATAGVIYYDMSGLVNSHEGIHDFYLQKIVPLLATDAPLPIAPSPVPMVPTTGGPAFANGRLGHRYESGLLRAGGVPAPVAAHLLRAYGRLDGLLVRGSYQAVGPQIRRMERFLTRQSGRGIPAAATPYLLGQLRLVEPLLVPAHPRVRVARGVGAAARHGRTP